MTRAGIPGASLQGSGWASEIRARWHVKHTFRQYYRTEYFARLLNHGAATGRCLEVGAGPGLFGLDHRSDVVTDIDAWPWVDLAADVHALPFADGLFDVTVGIDVLHHFARPGDALCEIGRVLSPGGRLILIEPWVSAFGWYIYRYLVHEDCAWMDDPWSHAFPAGKSPMDGNTTIPRQLFEADPQRFYAKTGLNILRVEPFAVASMILTGGTRTWGLPWPIIRALIRAEGWLPRKLLDRLAIKALLVAEKPSAPLVAPGMA